MLSPEWENLILKAQSSGSEILEHIKKRVDAKGPQKATVEDVGRMMALLAAYVSSNTEVLVEGLSLIGPDIEKALKASLPSIQKPEEPFQEIQPSKRLLWSEWMKMEGFEVTPAVQNSMDEYETVNTAIREVIKKTGTMKDVPASVANVGSAVAAVMVHMDASFHLLGSILLEVMKKSQKS